MRGARADAARHAAQAVPAAVAGVLGCRRSVLFALERPSGLLRVVGAYGLAAAELPDVRLTPEDTPLAAAAFRRGAPVVGSQHGVWRSRRRLVCVPLVADGDPVGVVFVECRMRNLATWRRRWKRANDLASVCAAALRYTERADAEAARAERLRTLAEVAGAMTATLSLPEVVARIVWGVRTLTGSRRAGLVAYEAETATLRPVSGFASGAAAGVRIPLSRSPLAQTTVLERRTTPVDGVAGDALAEAVAMEPSACIPLTGADGGVLGFVLLEGGPPAETLDQETCDLVGRLAAHAIESARRYQRARLSSGLAEASEVARDLHDTVSQTLFAIGDRARLLSEEDGADAGVLVGLHRITELAAQADDQLRTAFEPLRRGKPLLVGLGHALSEVVRDARTRTMLEIELDVDPALWDADDAVADVLYKTCREALSNIERHSHARSCRISCRVLGHLAVAQIEDDGVGFEPAHANERFGIRFLREAAEALSGSLEVARREPAGTVVTVRVEVDAGLQAPVMC